MLVTFNNLWRQTTQGKTLHGVLMKSNSFVFTISYTTSKHEWAPAKIERDDMIQTQNVMKTETDAKEKKEN